jgi:hypothetical protein
MVSSPSSRSSLTEQRPDPGSSDAAAYITQWIKIAEKCLTLNNFNSMVEIISGLQLPDIQKLKLVWSVCSPVVVARYELF